MIITVPIDCNISQNGLHKIQWTKYSLVLKEHFVKKFLPPIDQSHYQMTWLT